MCHVPSVQHLNPALRCPQVFIPFTNVSNKWDAATGEPTAKCSDDPKVCPDEKARTDIVAVGIWTEGAASDFHFELHSIAAGMGPTSA